MIGKKGSVVDGLVSFILVFVVALVVLSSFFLLDKVNTSFQNDSLNFSAGDNIVDENTARFPIVFDAFIVTILISLSVTAIILSYNVNFVPPVFFVVVIAFVIISLIMGYLGNVFVDVVGSSSALTAASTQFPLTVFLINNYLWYSLVTGFLMIIAFVVKPQ